MRRDYLLPRFLLNALRATAALALARFELRKIKPHGVLDRNREIASLVAREFGASRPTDVARSCDEAAFFINRMAARVPWRSDCLVQALAGQRWLARIGVASEIVVGTAITADGEFESHAWLRADERIVLGGDIARFQPLLRPDAGLLDRL